MLKIILLIIISFISCYKHPLHKQNIYVKNKPIYIQQYEERNKKEELKEKRKSKKEVIKLKQEKQIKYKRK